MALAGDHEVGTLDVVVQIELLGHQLEPRCEGATQRGEQAGDAACGARAVDLGHVDVELVAIPVGELFEPTRQHPDLRRRRALLRSEDARGIGESCGHVAGDLQVDAGESRRRTQCLERPEPTVGRRRTPEPDDHPLRPGGDRGVDELTRAGGRGVHRIVGLGAPGDLEPARQGHLDHGGAAMQPPVGIDRGPQRPGDPRGPVGATQHVEQTFAPVGHRHLDTVVAEFPTGVADRTGHLRRGRRAPVLVDRCNDLHAADRTPA